jgi:hypothetical protein
VGRVYLPLEDLARFDYTEEDLGASIVDERFVDLVRFEIWRTRQLYAFADEGMGYIPRGRCFAVMVAQAARGDPGPHRGTGLRRLFAIGGDLSPRQAQGRCHVCCAEPAADSGRRALHSPDGRDVISSQTRRATGGAHRERWRDGPCETAATGEAYRQASWQVPTPAEETPIDESKDLRDEASLHRERETTTEGATLEPESQRTIRRPDPFTNLAEPRLAYERVCTLGVPVLAYKTFVKSGNDAVRTAS